MKSMPLISLQYRNTWEKDKTCPNIHRQLKLQVKRLSETSLSVPHTTGKKEENIIFPNAPCTADSIMHTDVQTHRDNRGNAIGNFHQYEKKKSLAHLIQKIM